MIIGLLVVLFANVSAVVLGTLHRRNKDKRR
jgi:hypothetical protein